MNLETIATLLEDAGIAKPGVDLFLYRMPAEATGLLLREGYSGDEIYHELPGYRKGDFMLVYRGPDITTGKEKMREAMAALDFLNREFDGIKYHYVRPRRDPMVYPISPGGNFEISTYIDVCYVLIEG